MDLWKVVPNGKNSLGTGPAQSDKGIPIVSEGLFHYRQADAEDTVVCRRGCESSGAAATGSGGIVHQDFLIDMWNVAGYSMEDAGGNEDSSIVAENTGYEFDLAYKGDIVYDEACGMCFALSMVMRAGGRHPAW